MSLNLKRMYGESGQEVHGSPSGSVKQSPSPTSNLDASRTTTGRKIIVPKLLGLFKIIILGNLVRKLRDKSRTLTK